jgi:hypothetical protein
MDPSGPGPEMIEVHGFRVVALGRITPGFRSALGRLALRGFADPACTVVKTAPGPSSGITHWGGRYVHPANPGAAEAVAAMRELMPEPPTPPFLAAPGPCMLYHEWGHHVDSTWSRDDHDVVFSLRWISRFYAVRRLREPRGTALGESMPADMGEPLRTALGQSMPPGLEGSAGDWAGRGAEAADWPDVLPVWCLTASELFAELFETWMRGEDRMPLDVCDPRLLACRGDSLEPRREVEFLPGADSARVRRETFRLFEAGLRSMPEPPPVRPELFGESTERALGALRSAMARCRGQVGD